MVECRICGARCHESDLRSVNDGGGCVHCNGSPRCAACHHPRRDHYGSFPGSTKSGCRVGVAVDGTLGRGRCGCAGYTTEASAGDVGVLDIETPRLRIAGSHSTDAVTQPPLPVPDAFDQPVRLRDDEPPQWRPYDASLPR